MRMPNLLSLSTNCFINSEISIDYIAERAYLLSISPSREKYLVSTTRHHECLSIFNLDKRFSVVTVNTFNLWNTSDGEKKFNIHDDAVIHDISWMNNENIVILFVEIMSKREIGFYLVDVEKGRKKYRKYKPMEAKVTVRHVQGKNLEDDWDW